MTAYFNAWRRIFDYRGRSTRAEFWLFTLFAVIAAIIAAVIDGVLGTGPLSQDDIGLFGAIVLLAHILPSISVTIRRMHDIDKSGWLLLLGLIPIIGIVVLLVFACSGSTPGANGFGPHPRDIDAKSGERPAAQLVATEPAVVPSASRMSAQAPLDQLEKLAALKSAGAIDDDEFRRMKADLLAKSGA